MVEVEVVNGRRMWFRSPREAQRPSTPHRAGSTGTRSTAIRIRWLAVVALAVPLVCAIALQIRIIVASGTRESTPTASSSIEVEAEAASSTGSRTTSSAYDAVSVDDGPAPKPAGKISFASPIAYGTRGGGERTAEYVRDAILVGYRHIVTSSHHQNHNESGVGEGWTMAVSQEPSIRRSDLYLQTMFVPFNAREFKSQRDDPEIAPASIEEQVHVTVRQSLENLRTDYVDAVLFHNFRAKLYDYDEMMKAWRVLEGYVSKGTIRFLGMSNVHDASHLGRLCDEATVKPSVIQNRFHKNRQFDVPLLPDLRRLGMHVQRFWVLTGNGGGNQNAAMAERKGLSPHQLMLAFVMTLGSNTALVGTHDVRHMRDDLHVAGRYMDIFEDVDGEDSERKEFARKIGMKYPPPATS